MLVMEKFSGAAHAGLDFIHDEQQAVLSGQYLQIAQELIRGGPDAGFALDWLEHDADRFVIDQPFH